MCSSLFAFHYSLLSCTLYCTFFSKAKSNRIPFEFTSSLLISVFSFFSFSFSQLLTTLVRLSNVICFHAYVFLHFGLCLWLCSCNMYMGRVQITKFLWGFSVHVYLWVPARFLLFFLTGETMGALLCDYGCASVICIWVVFRFLSFFLSFSVYVYLWVPARFFLTGETVGVLFCVYGCAAVICTWGIFRFFLPFIDFLLAFISFIYGCAGLFNNALLLCFLYLLCVFRQKDQCLCSRFSLLFILHVLNSFCL